LWAAHRRAAAAEQIELYYGEHWKEWQPLNDVKRADILRAATGYALGEDTLGLGRLHEKYTAKMAETPDARAFEIVSAPLGTSGAEFREIARAAASTDTLNGFLRDMQARYPGSSPIAQPAPSAAPAGNGAPLSSVAPSTKPDATEVEPPPARAAAKTAPS
jgi:hypothetical protein